MARQPLSKYFPVKSLGGLVFESSEMDADDPAVDALFERLGGSYIDVQVTNAQLNALAAAPVQLVAAPGANRAVIIDALYAFIDVTVAKDDAAADGNLNLKYAGGADSSAGFEIEADALIDAAADTGRFYPHAHDYVAGAALVVTPVANVAVQLDNDGAEFTGGNATLSLRVFYHIVDFVAFT